MAQILPKSQLTSIERKDMETYLGSVAAGNLDLDSLRANWKAFVTCYPGEFSAPTFLSITGESVSKCDVCGEIDFTKETIAAYLGAHNVCKLCQKLYSFCDKCRTYVLTQDLGNPTHTHYPPSRKADLFLKEDNVDPYNADIMIMSHNQFLLTEIEKEIWKHQKEARVDLPLAKAHTNKAFRYFGVELEVEKIPGAPPDMITRTRKVFGEFVIVKHDGSLGNHGKDGFEIVTVPATLAYQQSGVWDSFFENLGSFFKYNSPAAGLHVHVNLDTISRVTRSKICVFANSPRNREFMESIAGRELGVASVNGKVYANIRENFKLSDLLTLQQHNSDCPWNPKNKDTVGYYTLDATGNIKKDKFNRPIIASIKATARIVRPVCRCAEGKYNLDKYQAINLSTKRSTLEIRIFRSIVDKNFFYAALEFVDALIDFCTETSPVKLGYKDFLAWLCKYNPAGQSKLYPRLSRLLVNKAWIDPPKKFEPSPEMKATANGK